MVEYRLSQHVLEVLLAQAGAPDRVQEFSHLLPKIDEITSDKEHISKSMYELWPDTLPVLQELKQLGYIIAIASNGAHAAKHELLLETLGVRSFIDHLVISSYVGVRKPNPEMLVKICEQMGLTKEEVVVVGDMLDRDVLMGNAAGVRSIWIDVLAYNPSQNIKRFKENNPLYRPTAGIVALSQLIPTIQLLDSPPDPRLQLQVGYYLPGIKKRLDMGMQKAFISSRRVRYIPIELLAPLECQEPLDVLVHKATDLHLSSDPEAQAALEALAQFARQHKELLVLDSAQALYTTTRRDKFEYILDFNEEDGLVRLPRVYTVGGDIAYPVLVKSAIACHAPNSHKIVSVNTPAGLYAALNEFGSDETIIQEMVQHSGLVYKVFVIGSDYSTTRRESLPPPTQDYHIYDSGKLSEHPCGESDWELDDSIVQRVNRKVQMASGMTLFGYDIVVERNTGCHVIVDLNYFPSYHGFPEFPQKLEEHIIRMHARHRSSLVAQSDPGF